MKITALLAFAAITGLSTLACAGEVTPAERSNVAQNGGDTLVAAPVYAAGLNGRVKPAARANAAQNGGETAVVDTPKYSAGLNGRTKPALPVMAEINSTADTKVAVTEH